MVKMCVALGNAATQSLLCLAVYEGRSLKRVLWLGGWCLYLGMRFNDRGPSSTSALPPSV